MSRDLVSVVIPAYDAVSTLRATLSSVLAQTHRALEVLVVDDGSRDATAAVAAAAAERDPRVRVLRQANAGVAVARNAGLAQARGEWVATVDADDLWHPEKIARQLAAAARAPRRPGFVYAWSRRIDGDDRVLLDLGRPTHRGDVMAQLVATNFLRNASVALMRRDAALRAGGFDPGLQAAGAHGAEDLKLYLAIAEVETVELAPAFLVGYRHTATSMSQAPDRMRRSVEMVLGEVERRRPDLPAELLDLARANYDFYAAHLAIAGRSAGTAMRYLAAALRRSSVEATALVGCAVVWRAHDFTWRAQDRPRFAELSPEERLRRPLVDWLDEHQRRVAERAALPRGARAPRSA